MPWLYPTALVCLILSLGRRIAVEDTVVVTFFTVINVSHILLGATGSFGDVERRGAKKNVERDACSFCGPAGASAGREQPKRSTHTIDLLWTSKKMRIANGSNVYFESKSRDTRHYAPKKALLLAT